MKKNEQQPIASDRDILKGRLEGKDFKITIILASYNANIVQGLLDGALKALDESGVTQINIVEVDGAFEIPLVAKVCIQHVDAVICLGAVIKGDTAHFDYVSNECARGIQQVMLEAGKPVVFGVLTTYTVFQAKERSLPDSFNEGYEVANIAVRMCSVMDQLT